MNTLEVVRRLPATLPWLIAFDLDAVRSLVDDLTVRRMFTLDPGTVLDGSSHVVLTPMGPHLAPAQAGPLLDARTGAPLAVPTHGMSAADRIADRLSCLRLDGASLTCLGVAEGPPSPLAAVPEAPVLLGVTVDTATGWGEAEALFASAPRTQPAALLRSVGVQYLGGEKLPDGYRARLRIHLPTHVQAGRLSEFTRGDNCTRLFMAGGEITAEVELGLALAGRDRVAEGHTRAIRAAAAAAAAALSESAHAGRHGEPPPPLALHDYSHLIALDLPLRALQGSADPAVTDATDKVRAALVGVSQGTPSASLRGGPTVTEPTPIHTGVDNRAGVESAGAAEDLRTGGGGHLPPLCAPEHASGHVTQHLPAAHGCWEDAPTIALLTGLHHDTRLPPGTERHVGVAVNQREGLFFANPYLADWALAQSLSADPDSQAAQQLLSEVLSSTNADHTFGRYDLAFSTALGILTLAALEHRGRRLRICQLRLLELLEADGGAPPATPFFRSRRRDTRAEPHTLLPQLFEVDRQRTASMGSATYEVSLLVDRARLISSAVAALALAVPCRSSAHDDPHPLLGRAPRRHRASDPADYVAQTVFPLGVDKDVQNTG